ncbi:hypothetical protein F5146DRAFT_325329 [Armillaria mellea]|nr:hypothetical protein F5146DRAFT_325329 [Armillaria mellea]
MQGSRGRKHLSVTLDPTSKLSSRIPISRNRGKLASRSTRAELQPCWYHLYKFTNSRISIISCTMFFCTFTALFAVVTAVASSPLAARDAGPKCTIVVTPKDSSYAAGAANQLTYGSSSDSANHGTTVETLAAPGFLYRFGQPTYPDGTSVTSISVSSLQYHSCTADILHKARVWSVRDLERRQNLHRRHCSHRDGSNFRSNRDYYRGAVA